MFRFSLNQLQHVSSFVKVGTAAAISASFSATLFLLSSSASLHQEEEAPGCMGIIETNMMEKIANKPYLNYHRVSMVVPTTKSAVVSSASKGKSTETINGDFSTTTTQIIGGRGIAPYNSNASNSINRPIGVPQQMRILTIDVPQFRNVFDRECHVDMTMVYPDGIAPPKRIVKRIFAPSDDNEGHSSTGTLNYYHTFRKGKQKETHVFETMDIIQKSLVKSLARCGDNGVVLLEASVKDLNPKNLQRRISFQSSSKNKELQTSAAGNLSESLSAIYAEEIAGGHVDDDSNCHNEEIDAPWNQHAWAEELKLRTSGAVAFAAPMHQSSALSHFLFGNCYRRTIVQQSLWYWLWLRPSNNKYATDDEGVSPVASNKPHAVIADGEAMQRVPGSLRELVRCCRNANVPLYIVNDPRVWGSNTHTDLPAAAAALRKTVKNRIIASALRIKEGSTFRRGQQLGRLEANILHELREQKNAAKRAIEEARKALKRDSKVEDWSQLSRKDLVRELMKRKVITEKYKTNESGGTQIEANLLYTIPFVSLCNTCVATQQDAHVTKPAGSHEESSCLAVDSTKDNLSKQEKTP